MSNTKTVTYEDIEVEVGPITLRGSLIQDGLVALIPDQKDYQGTFIICVSLTRSSKNLPFSLFVNVPDEAAFTTAYDAFLGLDAKFVTAWLEAVKSFIPNTAPGDKKKSS